MCVRCDLVEINIFFFNHNHLRIFSQCGMYEWLAVSNESTEEALQWSCFFACLLPGGVAYKLRAFPWMVQEFEKTLDAWMAEFHTYLALSPPALPETDPEKETVIDAVKGAVCANINLFMEMNEEEFAKFLGTFVQDVWTLLTTVTLEPRQVRLPAHTY